MRAPNRFQSLTTRSALVVSLFAAACSSGSSGSSGPALFVLRDTGQGVAAGSQVEVSGRFAAYLADEATTGTGGGTKLNGDNDRIDSVATVVDVVSETSFNVGVAALSLAWVGEELYMVVDEGRDDFDWNGDGDPQMPGAADIVLVHWSATDQVATFVATLDTSGAVNIIALDGRLIYTEALETQPAAGETSLRALEQAAPTTPIALETSVDEDDGLRPRLMGADEGLVYMALDETRDLIAFNGDGDLVDTAVLALLDGTLAASIVHNVGYAIADIESPVRARDAGSNDWLVGFLVNELASDTETPDPLGGSSFQGYNDPALFSSTWQPTGCDGKDDLDLNDDVLFWLLFEDWVTDPGMSPVVNTGLVGQERVLVVDDFVGTISFEGNEGGVDLNDDGDYDDDGERAGCDLNDDGDDDDRVLRWVAALDPSMPPLPPGHPDDHVISLADASDIPGGTMGVAELADTFVILLDENLDGTNYDKDSDTDKRLLAWFDPATSTAWTMDHGADTTFYGGATWMQETADRARLLAAVPESVNGQNLNNLGDDEDIDDSVPTFLYINEEPRLLFPFVRYPVQIDQAGITIVDGIAFYRVDEAADGPDGYDFNNDGDTGDVLLFRTDLGTGATNVMSTLSDVDRPAINADMSADDPEGAAIIASEAAEGRDFNGDGDELDHVLRYFRM